MKKNTITPFEEMSDSEKIRYLQVENKMLSEALAVADKPTLNVVEFELWLMEQINLADKNSKLFTSARKWSASDACESHISAFKDCLSQFQNLFLNKEEENNCNCGSINCVVCM